MALVPAQRPFILEVRLRHEGSNIHSSQKSPASAVLPAATSPTEATSTQDGDFGARLALELGAEAVVPLTRPEFVLLVDGNPTPLFRPSALGAAFTLALGMRL